MSDHDNDLFDTCCADVADTRFDYRLAAEGKQGLELAHASRTAGGKDYGSEITHALKLTTRNKGTNAPPNTRIFCAFVVKLCAAHQVHGWCIAAPFACAIDRRSLCYP